AVKVDRSHIVTDAFCATGEPGVYAIGDVAGAPWLAHKASHEAVICVEHIAGLNPAPLNADAIPACTYSHPQVAHVGLTETQAKAGGRAVRVGRFPFAANGKALAMGSTEGFVKVIFDEQSGELLGAHMVGDEVTEMIQGYAIAMGLETTEEDLMHTVFAHPTQSEAMHEAVLAAYGRALHI
ncbi:MAG: FAD-dependent oxidoreductase, partial [Alcaligenes sp.]